MSEMTYRTVTVTARVYSGSDDHAKHTVYWALQDQDYDVLIDDLEIKERGGVS
jgi:hypothetical protein